MAYATNAQVLLEIPQHNLGASTKPKTADIDTWLTDYGFQFDAHLRRGGYTVPITGVESLSILKDYTLQIIVSRIEKVINTGNADIVEYWQEQIDDVWKKIKKIVDDGQDGIQFLPDATWTVIDSSGGFSSAYQDSGIEDPLPGVTRDGYQADNGGDNYGNL